MTWVFLALLAIGVVVGDLDSDQAAMDRAVA